MANFKKVALQASAIDNIGPFIIILWWFLHRILAWKF